MTEVKNPWFKKHVDTVIVLAGVLGCFLWMNSNFNCLQLEMNKRFSLMEKEMAVMKTVLFMNGNYPKELAKAD